MTNNIEVHNDSDFILFLKKCEIKLTPEIRLLYYMSSMHICFVCHHVDAYNEKTYSSYNELKDHFIKKHTTDYEGNRRDKGYAFGKSSNDIHDHYSTTEYIGWNNNQILGLIDQLIVLENYLNRRVHMRRRDTNTRFNFYRDLGGCIIKIMKDYQIPQLMFVRYLGLPLVSLEKYTTTYYVSLPDNEKPGWMKPFLK